MMAFPNAVLQCSQASPGVCSREDTGYGLLLLEVGACEDDGARPLLS